MSKRKRGRAVALSLGFATLLVGGCGGSDDAVGQAGDTQSDSAQTNDAPTDETSTTAQEVRETTPSDSEPAETTPEPPDEDASPSSQMVIDDNFETPESWDADTPLGAFRNLVVDVHGPTDDLGAEVGRLNPSFPTDLPTPTDSDLLTVAITYQESFPPAGTVHTVVQVATPASSDDLVTLYSTDLVAKGYSEVTSATSENNGFTYQTLAYEPAGLDPDANRFDNALEIVIISGDEIEGSVIDIDHRTEVDDVGVRADLSPIWLSETEIIPEEAILGTVKIQSSLPSFSVSGSRLDLTFTEWWSIPDALGSDVLIALVDSAEAAGIPIADNSDWAAAGAIEAEIEAGTESYLLPLDRPGFRFFSASGPLSPERKEVRISMAGTVDLGMPIG